MQKKLLRWTRIAALCAAAGLAPAASATAFSTNYSDLWWNPTESGWGANITQQADVMFVTFFVYGPSGQPVWYVATLEYAGAATDGTLTWTGDLYQTSGPWFGTFWNPLLYAQRKVGTATFQSAFVAQATLSYSVDGVPVVKSVERQTLRNNDFGGTYYGGTVDVTNNCTNPANDNLLTEDSGQITITQNGTLIQIRAPSCTFTGTYTQQGQIGRADTNYVCTNSATGTATFFDLRVETSGVVGRYTGVDFSCRFDGNIGGYRRL
jgi:hypothetical protein